MSTLSSSGQSRVVMAMAAGVCAGVLMWWYMRKYKTERSGYVHLGSPYRPEDAGSRGEMSEECLQNPDYRMCTLTDGTPGVCGTSGMCVTDLSQDITQFWGDIKMPVCYEPLFKEGCQRFCNCKQLKGGVLAHEMDGCVDGCRNMFYPSE